MTKKKSEIETSPGLNSKPFTIAFDGTWINNSHVEPHTMTEEMLEELLTEIFEEAIEQKEQERNIHVLQGCKTYGSIDRGLPPFACSDPECVSCAGFHNLLAEEAKEFIKDDKNFK